MERYNILNQFNALMPHICCSLADMIAKKQGLSEQEAISKLYSSLLYSYLEDEEMKVWHYSTSMLYELYKQGEETGSIQFPDT